MTGYWASFARDGVPKAAGEPAWKPYGKDRAYMAFVEGPQPGVHLRPGMYELNETARVPPPGPGRHAVELERRRPGAAASRRDVPVPLARVPSQRRQPSSDE